MSTPRTDAAEFFVATTDKKSPDEGEMHVMASDARQLETELASLEAANDVLQCERDELSSALAAAQYVAGKRERELEVAKVTETAMTNEYCRLRAAVEKMADEYGAVPGTVIVNGPQFAAKLRELLK